MPRDSMPTLRVPDGWTLEPMKGDFVVLEAPRVGATTIDFERRGFRGGVYVTHGRFVGEEMTRRGPRRKPYGGHGWRQRLVDDAVAWLQKAAR